VADTDRQSRFVERSQRMIEMHWTTSRQDSGSHSDGEGGDNDDRDNEEEKDKDKEDKEDKDKEDKDEPPVYDSEIPGIFTWDLLGKDFEREAAALGLYSLYELPTQLTTL